MLLLALYVPGSCPWPQIVERLAQRNVVAETRALMGGDASDVAFLRRLFERGQHVAVVPPLASERAALAALSVFGRGNVVIFDLTRARSAERHAEAALVCEWPAPRALDACLSSAFEPSGTSPVRALAMHAAREARALAEQVASYLCVEPVADEDLDGSLARVVGALDKALCGAIAPAHSLRAHPDLMRLRVQPHLLFVPNKAKRVLSLYAALPFLGRMIGRPVGLYVPKLFVRRGVTYTVCEARIVGPSALGDAITLFVQMREPLLDDYVVYRQLVQARLEHN